MDALEELVSYKALLFVLGVRPVCMFAHICCPVMASGAQCPGTGATDACEPASEFWELNPDPLKNSQCF